MEQALVLGSRRVDQAYRMVPFPGAIGRVVESAADILRVALTSITLELNRVPPE